MNYELEIKWCSLEYKKPRPPNVVGPLESGRCFYIAAAEYEQDNKPMIFTVDTVDAYAPKSTGVYNLHLEKWGGLGDSP